jgi:hypothetical protein
MSEHDIPAATPSTEEAMLVRVLKSNDRILSEYRAELSRERDARQKHLDVMWALDGKMGTIALDVADVKGRVMQHDARLTIVEQRTDRLEGKQDTLAETTGRFQVDALRAELGEKHEAKRDWRKIGLAIVSLLGTALAGWIAKGCAF